jgi:hypothetical protein
MMSREANIVVRNRRFAEEVAPRDPRDHGRGARASCRTTGEPLGVHKAGVWAPTASSGTDGLSATARDRHTGKSGQTTVPEMDSPAETDFICSALACATPDV